MKFAPLTFQDLPPDIIRIIVKHLTDNSRLHYSGVSPDTSVYSQLQEPLLQVSRTWRAVVYSKLCQYCQVSLVPEPERVLVEQMSLPANMRAPEIPTNHFANAVWIHVDFWSVFNGRALRMLSQAQPALMFPSARQVRVYFISMDSDHDIGSFNDAEQRVVQFIQYFRQMVPAATDITLVNNAIVDAPTTLIMRLVNRLAIGLYRNATRVSLTTFGQAPPMPLDADQLSRLTHINYESDKNYEQFVRIIRHNADTLVSLSINSRQHIDVRSLVTDNASNSVVYHGLLKLTIKLRSYQFDTVKPNVRDVDPFPSLQQLSVTPVYAFGDDTLFRGNHSSLEFLNIMMDTKTIGMIKDRGVFADSKYTKLQHIKLSGLQHFESATSALVEFPQHMLPALRSLELVFRYTLYQNMFSDIANTAGFERLQMLSLGNVGLPFSGIISLVKSMTLLCDIHCEMSSMDINPQGITNAKLPPHMHATYFPLSHKFRFWNMVTCQKTSPKNAAAAALLMAVMCPDFSCAAVAVYEKESYTAELRKAMRVAGFRKFASQCKKLFY
ncbi:hypothetical protein LPJ66_002823 [Kickxella alabastrina]|uniref:Uncharacterized protein n=1 Tax=Kickxella alabastrina TaxID=61397 RepID=A0ACC1IPE9_9FUNG|nr:hypothetical protein LPJ66_002823 [Kickxella alabastrina]